MPQKGKNKHGLSRHIPSAVKAEVRKRCGFGCIVCGCPIYEYAHIEPFSEVDSHEADNIALLCRTHHGYETVGLTIFEDYSEFLENPFNLRDGNKGAIDLFLKKRHRKITLGGCIINLDRDDRDQTCEVLSVDQISLITIKLVADELLLDVAVPSVAGEIYADIQENELHVSAPVIFDTSWSGSKLKISAAGSHIEFDFNADGEIRILNFMFNSIYGCLRANEEGTEFRFGTHLGVVQDSQFNASTWPDRHRGPHTIGLFAINGDPEVVPVAYRYEVSPFQPITAPRSYSFSAGNRGG